MARRAPTKDPRAEYLESVGITDIRLDAPDVSAIKIKQSNPTEWVDKHGNPPPPGLEFYLLAPDTPNIDAALRRITRPIENGGKGYQRVSGEAGLHWTSRGVEEGQIVLVRTKEQRAAWIAGKRQAKMRRQGRAQRRSAGYGGIGDAVLEETTTLRDHRIALRSEA